MNKFLLSVMCALFLTNGCSKYNFEHIFPFYKSIYKKSVYIEKIDGFECFVDEKDFGNIDKEMRSDFSKWKLLNNGEYFTAREVRIDNNFFGQGHHYALYAVKKNDTLEGCIPVVVYFPHVNKIIFFIAEEGML